MERVLIQVDPFNPSPHGLMTSFAEVFASLDENPRELRLDVIAENEENREFSIGYASGDPVFNLEGAKPVAADFRRRWLAEYPVPLVLKRQGRTRIHLIPTSGNRVKVRVAALGWSSLFVCR